LPNRYFKPDPGCRLRRGGDNRLDLAQLFAGELVAGCVFWGYTEFPELPQFGSFQLAQSLEDGALAMKSFIFAGGAALLTSWLAVHVAYGGEVNTAKPNAVKAAAMVTAPAKGRPDRAKEPFLKQISLPKAIEYLDSGVHAHEGTCLACHGTFAYLATRPAISTMTSTHRQTRQALDEFAAKLAEEKLSPRETPQLRVSQTVLTAGVLAQHDAAAEKKLLPLKHKALDRIWDLQRDDGGWDWVKHDEPPSGIDDHFGVTMAAIAAGTAPDHYADTPQARKGLDRIRHYLREHTAANMHQRAMLLLAAERVDGLLTGEQCKQTVADLFALQRPDGGWAMGGLGDWKRADGTPTERAVSDGYGTGFAVYVLRQGGRIAADDPRLHQGLVWLKTHQRVSGCWFTRSPYKNDEVSTYAGTAYAILALDAGGEIPLQHN